MLRFEKTKVINGKETDVIHYWGLGLPMDLLVFEEAQFFTGRGLRLYKNGTLWIWN